VPGSPPAPDRPTDWREYRPAIWLAMLGIALLLVVNLYAGIAFLGAAIGVGAKIGRGRSLRARRR
jgi:hypothetical protein